MTNGNVERFNGRVAEYERYRTRYPAAVLDVLRERCGLTRESIVADVGAGTGMLAELFLGNGNRVMAVEPNAEMRAACERLEVRYPGLMVRDGTAEATGLEGGSVDMVAAGRAFHWFDPERSVAEFRRVLRPGGWVVLVSSGRSRDGSEKAREFERVLIEHGTDFGEMRGRYRLYDEMPGLFAGGEVVKEELRDEQELTLEEFVGQTQSLSVTPLPGHAKYVGMQNALREFFDRFGVDGVLRMGVTVSLMACREG